VLTCCASTAFVNEDFVNIAWDSAGVTTGPVTVPFVLSVGVGCSKVALPVRLLGWVTRGWLALAACSHMRTADTVLLTSYLHCAINFRSCQAVRASEGFGILACASVWPIISGASRAALRCCRRKLAI